MTDRGTSRSAPARRMGGARPSSPMPSVSATCSSCPAGRPSTPRRWGSSATASRSRPSASCATSTRVLEQAGAGSGARDPRSRRSWPTRADFPAWNTDLARAVRAAPAGADDGRHAVRRPGHPDRAPGHSRASGLRRRERPRHHRGGRRRRALLRLLPAPAARGDGRREQPGRLRAPRSRTAAGCAPRQAGPLPEPGLTLYGMRALFDRDSALYFKPGDLHRLAPWLLRFRTYCNEDDHAHGTAASRGSGTTCSTWSRRCGPTASSSSSTSRAWCSPPRAPTTPARNSAAGPDARARLRPARRHRGRRRVARARAGAARGGPRGFLIRQHWHVRSGHVHRRPGERARRDGVEISRGRRGVRAREAGEAAHARAHRRRRSRGRHGRARRGRLDDAARRLDRDPHPDGGRGRATASRSTDGHAVACRPPLDVHVG